MDTTDTLLLKQLTALAKHYDVPVAHLVEYGLYSFLTHLVADIPNLVIAVPELASL